MSTIDKIVEPPEASAESMKPVQAVERAFTVIESLAQNGAMTLKELNAVVSVNKASLLRLLFTLTENGYVKRNDDGSYTLTFKLYTTAVSSMQNVDRIALINEALSELNRSTGRVAQFSIEDGNQLMCLQSVGSSSSLFSIYTESGQRSPLYCTSAGKALLATHPNAQIADRWDALNAQRLTEHTLVDLQDFLRDMSETRRRQYALDVEENEYGIFCIGTVVKGDNCQPIGAISLTGTSLTPNEERDLAAALLPAARSLSKSFGCLDIVLIDEL